MKPLIFYHAHCTDGFGAAYSAWLKYGDGAEYIPCNYGKIPDQITKEEYIGREIYILDFSFPKETTDNLFKYGGYTVWLDHHKTAFEMWLGEIPPVGFHKEYIDYNDEKGFIELNNNKSGAMLTWEYFWPNHNVPMFIHHIDDRDRWQFKIPNTKEFYCAIQSYQPWSFEQWATFFHFGVTDNPQVLETLYDEGAAILRTQEAEVARAVKYPTECSIALDELTRVKGLAVNAQLHISEIGNELAKQSGTFGLIWYLGNDNKVKCSLRSIGDYDVSAIAKNFGGGGHKNAAGFETDILRIMSWLAK